MNKLWTIDTSLQRPIIQVTGHGEIAQAASSTIFAKFKEILRNTPDAPALYHKRGGSAEWTVWSWQKYYDDIIAFAKSLLKVGLTPFQAVCIVGTNAPEWMIGHLATIAAGGVAASIYPTNNPEACRCILDQSQSLVAIVENEGQLAKLLQIRAQLPNLKYIVQWSGTTPTEAQEAEGIYSWDRFLSLGQSVDSQTVEEIIAQQKPEQCCSLLYTSGTTGPPKAVMLSQDNAVWTAKVLEDLFAINKDDVVLSYLPLSHIAAQIVDIYLPFMQGHKVYFAQPDALRGSLGPTLLEVRPTVFFGVPRVWEKFEEKLRALANSPMGKMLDAQKIKGAIGFDRAKIMISGAAPIAKTTLEFFNSLGLSVMEVYGMSECCGPQTIDIPENLRPGWWKIGSAGKAIPGTELKICNPDAKGEGEVCWRGRNVFMGYSKNEKATSETFDDEGFLHSGDIGYIDADGFLFITGRIKELLITAGGENIPPVLIEDELKKFIGGVASNVIVVGDRKKFLSCLVALKTNPNPNAKLGEYPLSDTLTADVQKLLTSIGSSATTVQEAQQCDVLKKWIEENIEKANVNMTSHAQQIRKFAIVSQDVTVENGCLTASLKLKRHQVTQVYAAYIDKIYSDN